MPERSARAERLRLLFLGLVGTSTAAAGAACSGDEIRSEDFQVDACDGGRLSRVTPAVPVDYLELRSDLGSVVAPDGSSLRVVESTGEACRTATDKIRCTSALKSLRPTDARSPKAIGYSELRYLAFTRGDEVGFVTTVEAARAFLAPFENPNDGALLLEEFTEHYVQCGVPNARPSGDAFELYTRTGYSCGKGTHRDDNIVRVARDGTFTVVANEVEEEGDPNCVIGRRPEGYPSPATSRSVGEYLASAAELEAVSVLAFRRLVRELRAHGAPPDLVARAREAAKDEVRHARTTRRLAERFGGRMRRRSVGALPVRPLQEIAEENAREGCVRETFGALVATLQASRATDGHVREQMESIARDETEHAALAWDVAEWLDRVLDEGGRERTRRARADAALELERSLERGFTSELLGLPTAQEARALFARMGTALDAMA